MSSNRAQRKKSRTGIDTISYFGAHYTVDLSKGYPLLTTKEVHWKSMLRELLWYLSGEDHIRNLRQHTKIWDAWADADGNLETAYGRYWRRFPSPYLDAKGQWQVREVDQIQFVHRHVAEGTVQPAHGRHRVGTRQRRDQQTAAVPLQLSCSTCRANGSTAISRSARATSRSASRSISRVTPR